MFYRFAPLLCLALLSINRITAQNIVQNGDFEGFDRWAERVFCEYSDAEYFTFYVEHWNTPKSSSPDYFTHAPKRPCRLFPLKPHSGYAYLGLTINNSIGFREVINNVLREPMVPGQTYYVEYWMAPFHKVQKIYPGSEKGRGTVYHLSDGIQMHFHKDTNESSIHLSYGKVDDPHIDQNVLLEIERGKWHRVSNIYKADDTYTHMLFGNLTNQLTYSKEEYDIVFPSNINLSRESYYYFDDIFIAKAAAGYQKISCADVDPYRRVNSADLLFELGKADVTEDHVAVVMDTWKALEQDKIENINIRGYTDNVGTTAINDSLSEARAQNVKVRLLAKGFPADKVTTNSYGSEVAKASNNTEEGRRYNRRVEISFNVRNELSEGGHLLFEKYKANDRSKMTGAPLVLTHNQLGLSYPAKALIYSSNDSEPEQVIDIKSADDIQYGLFKQAAYRIQIVDKGGSNWVLRYAHQ